MDDQLKQKLLQHFSNSLEDQESRRLGQDVSIEKVRRGMLTPEQIAFEDSQLKNLQATSVPQNNPTIDAQLAENAMLNYNSPEAQATRAKYDPDFRKQQFNAIKQLVNRNKF